MKVPTAVSAPGSRYRTGLQGFTPKGFISSVGFSEITSDGIIRPVSTASTAQESIITAKLSLLNLKASFPDSFLLRRGFLRSEGSRRGSEVRCQGYRCHRTFRQRDPRRRQDHRPEGRLHRRRRHPRNSAAPCHGAGRMDPAAPGSREGLRRFTEITFGGYSNERLRDQVHG